MIFSKKCEYAIRALSYLAGAGRVCDAREISRRENAPYPFMAKVLQELSRKGFVRSVKGVGGGFKLANPPHCVRLMDVFLALDGKHVFGKCLYGFAKCSDAAPCPLHDDWKILQGSIETYLTSHTLAQLSQGNPGQASED
ncbi:MAG: Rrf2 family transcriptional regulator [Acidobacteria bacterium]|nr:Rrf2 family transcriptional regulator [Acidobacteriota bacterium]